MDNCQHDIMQISLIVSVFILQRNQRFPKQPCPTCDSNPAPIDRQSRRLRIGSYSSVALHSQAQTRCTDSTRRDRSRGPPDPEQARSMVMRRGPGTICIGAASCDEGETVAQYSHDLPTDQPSPQESPQISACQKAGTSDDQGQCHFHSKSNTLFFASSSRRHFSIRVLACIDHPYYTDYSWISGTPSTHLPMPRGT